ncbi:MAG: cache domain-containing protein, partial [Blautia coccoides]
MLQSIRSKVLLAILAVTMVTACSITVVFYFKSAGMIEENYSTNLYGRVKQTVTSLDDSLQEIYYINVKAAGDINMAQYIKEYRKSESGEALDKIAELLRNYRTEYKDLSSLYFVFPDERIAVTSEDYPVCKRDIPEEEIVKIRQTEAEEAVPIMFGDMVHDTGKQLSCIQSVTDEDGTVLGYMLANTEERTLFYEYLEPVYDGKVSQALILDKNREIVTSMDYESVGQVYEGVDRLPEVSGIENQDAKEIRIFYQGAFSKCGLYM